MIAANDALADLITAGARMIEAACGTCPGLGAVPQTGAVSLRSFNRNFEGRCGAPGVNVYLSSPVVCAAAAITGEIVDPRTLDRDPIRIRLPRAYRVDDRMIIPPAERPEEVEIRRGPNIQPIPRRGPLEDTLQGRALVKAGDNVSTDGILPAHAPILALRSNVPAISEHVFKFIDPKFVERAKALGGGFIVAGFNYGQGSSREHAALAPSYLGVKAVIAKSFARIHRANLTNFGVLPLTLVDPDDYDQLDVDDELEISNVRTLIAEGATEIAVLNKTKNRTFQTRVELTDRLRKLLLKGGLMNSVGENGQTKDDEPQTTEDQSPSSSVVGRRSSVIR